MKRNKSTVINVILTIDERNRFASMFALLMSVEGKTKHARKQKTKSIYKISSPKKRALLFNRFAYWHIDMKSEIRLTKQYTPSLNVFS